MELEFFPFDYQSLEIDNKDVIEIFGRATNGKTVCILDYVTNFFYILSENKEKIKKLLEKEKLKHETVKKNYLGKPVETIKVYCQSRILKEISEKIKILDKTAQVLEADIKTITRYIIEKNLKPMYTYKISGEMLNNSHEFNGLDQSLEVDIVLRLDKILEESENIAKPKVMALDIETEEFEIGKGKILMIALVSEKIKKVLTWSKSKKKEDYVEVLKDESEMLSRFAEIIKKESPDILTGYFSDNFDLPYIRARAEKLKVKMNLGKDDSRITFTQDRLLNSKIKGLVHIDIFKFIERSYSQYLQSETLSLGEVAQELLGETKIKTELLAKKTQDIKDHEWDEFFEYNLQDTVLTYKLFDKVWQDLIGFTRVMQEPLYDVSRDGMSQHVEDYLIHNLKRFNEIVAPKPTNEEIRIRQALPSNEGAFVLQPEPKLYEDLAMFDFTSYWPSIIVTFNLSRSTFLGEKKVKDALEVKVGGKTFYFSKTPGFFPELLKEVIEKRKQYKQELKKSQDNIKQARSNAYKVLANASYGYLGFFGGRYYCYEAQGATTGISRDFIKKIIDKTNQKGYKVIYADTDGFAFLLNGKSKEKTLEYLKELNSDLPGIMELELEDFYKRGIFVTKRSGDFGAKKKYALINEQGKLKIRGFETVRRDWCQLARKLQSHVLKTVLNEGKEENALKYTEDIIKKLRERKIDKKELIIKTQLKKPVEEYKSITPHVIIAKKMHELGMPVKMGTLIEYYIAETLDSKGKSKKLVRDKAKLPNEEGEYDIDYYVNNQILPAVENIFQVFNIDLKEKSQKKQQKKLFEF